MTEETMKGLWQFETNKPNSCGRCLYYEGKGTFTGDMLDTFFPDLTMIDADTIKVNLHPNCDCELHRSKESVQEMTDQQQQLLEEWISEEIEKLRTQHPRYAAMSTEALRPLALRIIAVDRTQTLRKIVKEDVERQRSTVGNLYGKTRAQILKEQEEEK